MNAISNRKIPAIALPTFQDGLVALIYFAFALAPILIFGITTPVWLANAVALTALLHKETKDWPGLLILLWIADGAALSFGEGQAILLSLCDVLEASFAATLIRVTGGLGAPLFSGWALPRFILICIIAPIPSSAIGAGLLWWTDGLPFLASWAPWYSGTSLGLLILTPFLVSWTLGELRPQQLALDRLPRAFAMALILSIGFLLIFQQGHAALLFVTFPALLLVVWATGLLGATIAAIAIGAVSIWFTLHGTGPIVTLVSPASDVATQIQALQLYLASMFLSSFPLAVILAHQQALVKEREKAMEARSNFLAVMSHEIRTPLTGVLGMADLLVTEDLTKVQKDYVTNIRVSGRHLVDVLNDILDFTRFESGKLELERIDFSLPDVLERVRHVANPLVRDRDVELHFEFSEHSPPIVKGDPTRIKQVLLNLVGNAIKFTLTGSVRLHVSHRRAEKGGLRFRFEVHDTGIGIAPEKQAALFTAFSQADPSTTREYGGTGLGLAISKRLIEAMGGEIGFSSGYGTGSLFWFEIPLEIGSILQINMPVLADAEILPQRILVAEDVDINREILDHVLTRDGHVVAFAENGAEAVELVQRQPFDLVLMDVQMPVMDGVEATRRIRALAGVAGQVPILALTANVMTAERERYLAAGMSECLLKPIDWVALKASIAHYGRQGLADAEGGQKSLARVKDVAA